MIDSLLGDAKTMLDEVMVALKAGRRSSTPRRIAVMRRCYHRRRSRTPRLDAAVDRLQRRQGLRAAAAEPGSGTEDDLARRAQSLSSRTRTDTRWS